MVAKIFSHNGTQLVVSFFYGFETRNKMKVTIEISEQELKDLKRVRNYFGENDKTMFEHAAYAIVDNVVKKLQQAHVSGSLPDLESQDFFDLMQQYRIAPMGNQELVIKCYERVKEWLRANCH